MNNKDIFKQLLERMTQSETALYVGQVVGEQHININFTSEDAADLLNSLLSGQKGCAATQPTPSPTLREVLLAALPHVKVGGDWEAVCMLAHDLKKPISEQQIVDELATMPEVPIHLKVTRPAVALAYWDTQNKWPDWQIPTSNRSKAKAKRHIKIAEAIYPLLNRF